MKEEVKEVRKELNDIKHNTWFLDVNHRQKMIQDRFFYMWLVTFIAFISLLFYTIYLLNDIGVETTTKESYEIQQDGDNGNNNFINGNKNEVNNAKN